MRHPTITDKRKVNNNVWGSENTTYVIKITGKKISDLINECISDLFINEGMNVCISDLINV